jgi:uncharacterized protein (TIGR00251 family)
VPPDGVRRYRLTGQGLRLEILVQPGAGKNEVEGIRKGAEGISVLKLRVTTPPEGGKANAAVIKLLAKSLRLPKSAFEIVRGASARRKSLRVEGDAKLLAPRFDAFLNSLKGD